MSRWIEIAKMRADAAKYALNAIRSAAEAKGITSEVLRAEWAESVCSAALSVRALDADLFRRMGDGVRCPEHWKEARDHAAWMLRQLGFTLEEAAWMLYCERTAVSRMSRRYAPL